MPANSQNDKQHADGRHFEGLYCLTEVLCQLLDTTGCFNMSKGGTETMDS